MEDGKKVLIIQSRKKKKKQKNVKERLQDMESVLTK